MVSETLCAMEADAMRGDEVEFFSQIGEGDSGIDARDDAAHIQQCRGPMEERLPRSVQPQTLVTQRLADIEKVARAAAQIENTQRRAAIEPKILRPFDIDCHPVGGVIEAVNLQRLWPGLIKFGQLSPRRRIEPIEKPLRIHRVSPAADVLRKTLEHVEGKQFPEFLRKSHPGNDATNCGTDKF